MARRCHRGSQTPSRQDQGRARPALIKDALRGLATDPNEQDKPLTGDLAGYRSLRAGGQRYRILYKAEDEKVTVYVVAVGIRKEGDAADVYEVAKKLLQASTEKQNRRRKLPQS